MVMNFFKVIDPSTREGFNLREWSSSRRLIYDGDQFHHVDKLDQRGWFNALCNKFHQYHELYYGYEYHQRNEMSNNK